MRRDVLLMVAVVFLSFVVLTGHGLSAIPSSAPSTQHFTIQWGQANQSACAAFCPHSPVCSTDTGWRIPYGGRGPVLNPQAACKFLMPSSWRYYDPSSLLDFLGHGAALVLVGDSIQRHLFAALLGYLGKEYAAWWAALQEQSAAWRGPHRDKLEHTFVCSPPLGPRNLTVAFLWRPFFGEHLSKVRMQVRVRLQCVPLEPFLWR